jgi:type IV fimbrial biogenesis protein FimT
MLEGDRSDRHNDGRARAGAAPGFTLVELMVVVMIAAILLGIAVPALQNLFAVNQLNSIADSFAAALNEARSEAGKYGVPVALTSAGGTNWGSGWTMFVDTNGNGTLDAGQTPPEITLRTGSPVPASYTMTADGASAAAFAGKFWFDSTGRLLDNTGASAVASALFQVCQGGGPPGGAARLITVAPSGRVRVAQNNASGQPLDDQGNAVTTCP